MALDRRHFLRGMGLAGMGMAFGVKKGEGKSRTPALEGPTREASGGTGWGRNSAPKRLLILGGTGFIGPHMVRHAVERGHEVTIFTRGQTEADIPDVEHLVGDRNEDLSALEGRRWDVVLDNDARDYRWVLLSTRVLREAASHYLFVSSLSAYIGEAASSGGEPRVFWEPTMDESAPLFTPPPDFRDGDEAPY